jgi:hypothetical protein
VVVVSGFYSSYPQAVMMIVVAMAVVVAVSFAVAFDEAGTMRHSLDFAPCFSFSPRRSETYFYVCLQAAMTIAVAVDTKMLDVCPK